MRGAPSNAPPKFWCLLDALNPETDSGYELSAQPGSLLFIPVCRLFEFKEGFRVEDGPFTWH